MRIDKEEATHFLVKLSHLKNPEVSKDEYDFGPISEDKKYYGILTRQPVIGQSFFFSSLCTSLVQSIYSPSEMQSDKLVLPKGFPEPEKLDIPELLESDILIATLNSLYLLRKI